LQTFELSEDGKTVEAKTLTFFLRAVFDFVMGRRVFNRTSALDAFLAMLMLVGMGGGVSLAARVNFEEPAAPPSATTLAPAPSSLVDLWSLRKLFEKTSRWTLSGTFLKRDTLTGDWNGFRNTLQNAGITFGLLDQSEVWGNLAGGLRRGTVFNGLTTASLKLDLAKLVCWPGATFFIDAFQIHGRGPSQNLVGNMQLVSNIEATRDIKLYDLWLQQKLLGDRLSIRIGQEGANDEMMITQYGALFLNSSFGFPGLPAADLPSGGPNYPMATPFVRVSLQATDQITLVGAIYNGDPAPPGTSDPQLRDAGGTAFRLNDDVLLFGELWYAINQEANATGMPGTYKLGVWYSSSRFPNQLLDTAGLSLANPASTGISRSHSGGFAVYGIIDQLVWKEPSSKAGGIGLFLLAMGAPQSYNLSNVYVEGGMNWKEPFHGRENDIFGFGVAYLGISPAKQQFGNDVIFFTGSGSPYNRNETVLEATYLWQVAPWLMLQPDAQYVITPGAGIPSPSSRTPLKNAFIIGIRTSVQF
jgi:porin